MNNTIKNDDELIKIINSVLNDFKNFDKAFLNNQGDIIIKNNKIRVPKKENSILTNVFKKIIADDIKKNRV